MDKETGSGSVCQKNSGVKRYFAAILTTDPRNDQIEAAGIAGKEDDVTKYTTNQSTINQLLCNRKRDGKSK